MSSELFVTLYTLSFYPSAHKQRRRLHPIPFRELPCRYVVLLHLVVNFSRQRWKVDQIMLPPSIIMSWSFTEKKITAWPESLEDYFKKLHIWVKKRHLIFGRSIPGQIRKNRSRAFEGLSYLAYKIKKKKKIFLFIFFIHLI